MTPTPRIAALTAALLGGCASPLAERFVETAHVQARWLPPITAGATPVGALAQAFGPPTAVFEGGHLRCWVLMLVEKELAVDVDDDGCMRGGAVERPHSGEARTQRRAALDAAGELRTVTPADHAARALWPTWREAEYHLVAAVDEAGIVERWSFTRALP